MPDFGSWRRVVEADSVRDCCRHLTNVSVTLFLHRAQTHARQASLPCRAADAAMAVAYRPPL